VSTRAYDDPVREQRRIAALGQIRQFGDPVLRTPADPITTFDDALRAEAERMIQLMDEGRGAGLAANQVGRLHRMFVMQSGEDDPPEVICNPVIAWRSDEEDVAPEGCLSIGEVTVEVPRAVAIRVEAQDIDGQPFTAEYEGFTARVVQHEMDHLDGVLMLDRTTPEQRREALRELRSGSR
jgi:peptide deformylase